jgi:osmoprotectant transport system permease protein
MTPALAREILQRSGEHLLLVALAVALALLIALPLGVAIRDRPSWARLVLGLANGVQTSPAWPSLACCSPCPCWGASGPRPQWWPSPSMPCCPYCEAC